MKAAILFVMMIAAPAWASVSEKAITEEINKRFTSLTDHKAWKEYLQAHPDTFPKDPKETYVKVEKTQIKVGDETYTVGMGYSQVYIQADPEKVKKVLTQPELFKELYGLDADSKVSDTVDGKFKARIFKKVAIISDQDYVLEYSNTQDGPIWFQRAKLVEDKKNFALRDNLKTLEPFDKGVILREVSMVYILKWYGKLFGPQARGVMEKELKKVATATKLCIEGYEPVTNENAAACWKAANK